MFRSTTIPSTHSATSTSHARAFDALIESGPLSVAFQPIVDLARAEPFAYEILGRVGTLRGSLADIATGPLPLLNAAHRCGRLLQLDRRWREIAIERIASFADEECLYFLNVDPRTAEDPTHTSGFTRDLVALHGLRSNRFVLELTEAPSVDPRAIERILREYEAQGFSTAIDDLGAPLQSLETLLRVRPGYIKVDRAVAHGIDHDDLRQHLLRSLVDFCERAGARLIVEGIETEGELRAVRDAGAQLAQGYLLGRPAAEPGSIAPPSSTTLRDQPARAAAAKIRAMEDALLPLVQVVEAIATTRALEPVLAHVTSFASELLGVERVTIRLLDESRSQLLVAARTGPSMHSTSNVDFAVGEGLVGWVVQNKQTLLTGHASRDPRFAAKPAMIAFDSFLGVPLKDEDGCIGVLATSAEEPNAFTLDHERRLRLVAAIVSPRLQLARLQRLLLTDPLTCVWNRRALDDLIPIAHADVTYAFSVVAIDVDRFKAINDLCGHAAGDDVLRAVARALSSVLRECDHVVRIGGEEFVLVLKGATREQARMIAERARLAVRGCDALENATVTVSAGVAERRAHESRDALLARADAALYRAKARGRDCVDAQDAGSRE